MAYNLGLGMLYSRFFVLCAKLGGRVKKILQFSEGQKVVSCLVIGYPDVKYQRIAPRKEVQVKVL